MSKTRPPKRFRDLARLAAAIERLEASGFAVLSPVEAGAVRELVALVDAEEINALGPRAVAFHGGMIALDRAARTQR